MKTDRGENRKNKERERENRKRGTQECSVSHNFLQPEEQQQEPSSSLGWR